ncbi:GNAT family N-acetyltransferase [Flavobacterium sp. LC2016-01]|uniref:GNAT family N-acetyltransferase n=1 Tax=Flavobacterium sp. LC2016-01 TaxID=2675876 RepID=UPI0012BB19B6|nr:GNAT family N-acetyltransferase [Flavobacterium sp. LC2016-01]MTH15861.1 GNAT family N-acetyltransferase [Flavobacterium sp. LC2016-01]
MLTIKQLYEEDSQAVRAFVLNIENDEFKLDFEPHEQPDLYNLDTFYEEGGFWIARYDDVISGTIGLQPLSSETAVIRHLFVEKEHRGKETRIAQQLFRQLLMYAKVSGYRNIYLHTPEIAVASQHFFLRNGFQQINDPLEFPTEYKFADRNSKLYHLRILF